MVFPSVSSTTPDTTITFIYDEWNLIYQEVSGASTTSKTYVWGQDLSGSIQGAGGVGGLLSSRDLIAGSSSYYTYDANGNVSEVMDNAGTIQAHYEYDPFGNVVVTTGTLANENEFQFSTKYFDAETGLNYYGYRYYSLNLGRWINRDPIEEQGGYNLYGFVENDGINYIDIDGRQSFSGHPAFDNLLERDTKRIARKVISLGQQIVNINAVLRDVLSSIDSELTGNAGAFVYVAYESPPIPIGTLPVTATFEVEARGTVVDCCTDDGEKKKQFDGKIIGSGTAGLSISTGGGGAGGGASSASKLKLAKCATSITDVVGNVSLVLKWSFGSYSQTNAFQLGSCSLNSGCQLTFKPSVTVKAGTKISSGSASAGLRFRGTTKGTYYPD